MKMKKFLEVVGAVVLAVIDGKRVTIEVNEASEQKQTFQSALHPAHT